MILTRIPQRRRSDCAICSVAMVLKYDYEKVAQDRREKYGHHSDSFEWWKCYLKDEGFETRHYPLDNIGLSYVFTPNAKVVGLLHMQNHELKAGHLVAIDEIGVLDPSDGFREHVAWPEYLLFKPQIQRFQFDSDFLAIFRMPSDA